MAWNLEAVKQQGVAAHQRQFLEREFGLEEADRLQTRHAGSLSFGLYP